VCSIKWEQTGWHIQRERNQWTCEAEQWLWLSVNENKPSNHCGARVSLIDNVDERSELMALSWQIEANKPNIARNYGPLLPILEAS